MFAKRYRFSFKKGVPKKITASPFFVMRYDTNMDENLHCAVIVGKKVDRKATERNKIKRKVVSTIQEILPVKTPYSIVFYARKPIIEKSNTEIKEELLKIFKKTQIIK